jgi:DNA-binding GntR family transcriptional regulator
MTVRAAAERLAAEFLEMPGLHLTERQIQRLCGIDHAVCAEAINVLVAAKFLCAKPGGTYARAADGHSRRVA